MLENSAHASGLGHGSEDLHPAFALRTFQNVNEKHALEKHRRRQPVQPGNRAGIDLARLGGLAGSFPAPILHPG